MLPTKVFQLDYQDFANLVWSHLDVIEEYQLKNGIKFDCVLAKLRNGTVPGSIISTYLNLPLAVIEMPRNESPENFRVFWPSSILEKKEKINVLYVDSICGTGQTVSLLKQHFVNQNKFNIVTHATLVDVKAKVKPDIIGTLEERFIQPPWEWTSFTPQAHLDRLASNSIKASMEDKYCIGFSSKQCKDNFEEEFELNFLDSWTRVFEYSTDSYARVKTTSGISTIEIPEDGFNMHDAKNMYKILISEKVEFIQRGGITHFIENDWVQAVLVSQNCPVCHVIFFDGEHLHKIYAKSYSAQKLANLTFEYPDSEIEDFDE